MWNLVVLRPSVSVLVRRNPLNSHNDIFLATKASVAKLHHFLDRFDLSTKSGIGHLDEKWVWIDRHTVYDPTAARALARKWRCNILGGVFLNFIEVCGFTILDCLGQFTIQGADEVFYNTLYPGMRGYFDGTISRASNLGIFWEGVLFNNTGPFKVLRVDGDIRQLAYAKRVFREGLRQCIPSGVTVVDNAVHTPESPAELEAHLNLFMDRIR